MANTFKVNQSNVICGLQTTTHTIGTTNMYHVLSKSTIHPGSALSITVSQSGSTTASFTSTAPSSSQRHIELNCSFNCVIGDVITVAITSSAAIDNGLNNVSTVLAIYTGANL